MIVASGIPAFCSVSDNARDAFVPSLLVKPSSLSLSLLSSSSIFFLPPSLEISSQYVISLDENREIRITGIGSYVCNRYVLLGRQKDEFFLWHGRVSV